MDAEYLGSRVSFFLGFFTFVSYLTQFRLLLPDLTPNPGLWWYFMTEMFDHFRPFFLMAFSVSTTFLETHRLT
jgi:GPI transamidase subunit PIG-U